MADATQLEMLKRGVAAWNGWRDEHRREHIDLIEADLTRADLLDADLYGTDLVRARLSGANLTGANLRRADLDGANLSGAKLTDANLSDANLSVANLHSAILTGADLSIANLTDANVSGANLSGAKLMRAKLSDAHLGDADLRGANLHGANLTGANLSGANLTGAKLSRARLSGAWLLKANLGGANLTGANLTGANLDGAECAETIWSDVDLSTTVGLDSIVHSGPSTIDFRTLQRSGPLPLVFLRGCGLPENLIQYLPSLLNQAIQFYSCFISYSSKDQEFAEKLHADLQDKGVRCWYAPEDMKIGDRFRERIDESIRVHDKLLLILSENSIQSRWVETEVEAAFEREHRQGDTVLFPVRLDASIMDSNRAWAADIRRTRHIGDFCKWKDHDSYVKVLNRLLRDLKPEADARGT